MVPPNANERITDVPAGYEVVEDAEPEGRGLSVVQRGLLLADDDALRLAELNERARRRLDETGILSDGYPAGRTAAIRGTFPQGPCTRRRCTIASRSP